jgi:3-isopropylmalate dehydrogenase
MSANRVLRVVLLPGDGVGPEVVAAGRRVLEAIATHTGVSLELSEHPIGGAALDAGLAPLPPETFAACESADGILLGAVGGPRWDANPPARRPERGLLELRRGLELFANIRPCRARPSVADRSPLKAERLVGVDLVVVRELSAGLYSDASRLTADGDGELAVDECIYHTRDIERIVRVAARVAAERGGALTSIDKANVLETSRLWRRVVSRVIADEFPSLRLRHLLVDAAAMELVDQPRGFDVIVTENMFGDILTDLSAVLSGGIGLLPSACFGARGHALYEAIHGSAPTIAGKGIANPIGTVLSAALLCRHSLGLPDAARAIEEVVDEALADGLKTPDLTAGTSIGTREMTEEIVRRLADRLSPVQRAAAVRVNAGDGRGR